MRSSEKSMREIRLWVQGFLCSGMEGRPEYDKFLGVYQAENLRDAVNMLVEKDPAYNNSDLNMERLTYWGCRFYEEGKAAPLYPRPGAATLDQITKEQAIDDLGVYVPLAMDLIKIGEFIVSELAKTPCRYDDPAGECLSHPSRGGVCAVVLWLESLKDLGEMMDIKDN